MISINFNLRNPWSTRCGSLGEWSGLLPIPNKAWEVETCKSSDIVNFSLYITHRQDHAGVRFELGLFGWNVLVNVYDVRHWDIDNNCWVKHGD